MSNCSGLKLKAGIFIGDALRDNKDHPIEKVTFKDVYLGEDGLMRLLEAINVNKNITKAHIGIVSNQGLLLMARSLRFNTSLKKLKFQEHTEKRWEEKSKEEFVKMLRMEQIPLSKVKFQDANEIVFSRKEKAKMKEQKE